jgi:hypothetical protein
MNARKSVLILMLACAVLVSCSSPAQDQDVASSTSPDTGTNAQGTTGILKISLTDAPPVLNIEKALITISTVQVHRAGEASGAETEAGWVTIVETPQTFDLILLRDAKTLLGAAELGPGKYTQIRLKVEEAVATIEGTEHTLKVPSGTIKLIHPFTIEAGRTTDLILDFDAEKSIHAAGKKYMLRPTIKVTVEGPTS